MLKAKTMWKYRRPLWRYRKPLLRAAGKLQEVKYFFVPRPKSKVEQHWGKALMAGAGVGLGYLLYRSRRAAA
jgi:hypothetical protein